MADRLIRWGHIHALHPTDRKRTACGIRMPREPHMQKLEACGRCRRIKGAVWPQWIGELRTTIEVGDWGSRG